jgi:signal transduction histidine kinase
VSTSPPTTQPAPPRLYRSSEGRVLAGVARGLADHLGVDVLVVRLAFVLLAAAGGAGLLLMYALGLGLRPGLAVPLVALGVGVSILWRQADDDARARWRAATGTHRFGGAARAGVGVALVLVGAAAILGPANLDGTTGGLVAALVVAAGLALVSSPWWVRMARDLAAERSARIREQERAEVAAHVHDSVLHTLTLIQRHVDDPREVTRLARAQERELRGWLYRPAPDATQHLAAALERVAAEVEDAHGVAIEVVVVGDCALDDRLTALRDASREALVNAAKYAAGAAVSVYAEVEPEQVNVFVRDRGPGFDPDTVPEDRLGLRQSVRGRMTRNGGTATVRSSPGDGTEVQLEMPRQTRSAP